MSFSLGASVLWLLPALALAAGLALWAYPARHSLLGPSTRRLLRFLRFAGWLSVFLLALAPVLRRPEGPAGRFRVIALFDRSLSMDLPSGGAGTAPRAAREAAVEGALRRDLGSRFELLSRGFARTLADSAGTPGPGFRGATALGDALAGAGGYAAGRPAAVVVVSDGVVTQGEEAWSGAERLGLPVFPVLAADSAAAPDAELSEVAANATAYVGRPTPVRITVRSRGLAGRATAVEISENGRSVARSELRLPRAGESEVELVVSPSSPGTHFYDVRLAPVPGELTDLNNHRVVAVEALADKARVVMVQGAPSFDFSFVRRSLEEEPDLAPEFWTAGPGGAYLRVGGGETATPAQLAARIGGATVVALGDLSGAPGLPVVLAAAAARVHAGGGLWVYGGARAGLAFYRGTPVAPLLPFDVDGVAAHAAPLSPEPAPEARQDALFGENGVDDATLKRWDDLPPAAGVYGLRLRLGARRVLAAAKSPTAAVAAWIRPGAGRVFALNTAQLYRWTFTAQGAPGGNDVFPAFLSRAWRWLNEPAAGPALSVRPARLVVGLGEALEADVTGQKAGERVSLEAVSAEGRATPMTLTEGAGGLRGSASLPPGRYRLVARAYRGAAEVARAQAEAAVEPTGAEYLESAPDAGSLERVAAGAGFRLLQAADTTALVRALEAEARRPRGVREDALHRQLWPYALILLIFGTEWWVRRRRGLP